MFCNCIYILSVFFVELQKLNQLQKPLLPVARMLFDVFSFRPINEVPRTSELTHS